MSLSVLDQAQCKRRCSLKLPCLKINAWTSFNLSCSGWMSWSKVGVKTFESWDNQNEKCHKRTKRKANEKMTGSKKKEREKKRNSDEEAMKNRRWVRAISLSAEFLSSKSPFDLLISLPAGLECNLHKTASAAHKFQCKFFISKAGFVTHKPFMMRRNALFTKKF